MKIKLTIYELQKQFLLDIVKNDGICNRHSHAMNCENCLIRPFLRDFPSCPTKLSLKYATKLLKTVNIKNED
jgi:hypothetical protein